MIRVVFSVLLCLMFLTVQAQVDLSTKHLTVKKISEPITVDGDLTESVWSNVTKAESFIQYFPTDTAAAKGQTEIYMVYDEDNLYVGIKCYGAGNNWLVNSLKRDYRAGGNDNITLVFDSFQDKTNAFFFGINPEGVIREGVITNGGNDFRNFDESWDNKWRGESKKFDGYYTAELEIPFSALRFSPGCKMWNFGAYRFDTQDNEWSTWTGVPQNYPLMCLAYNGIMEWEEPLKSKGNYAFIPFIAAGVQKDFENDLDTDWNFDVGGDAKIAVTSGLNLDLTVNPDFSQVEVDQQITDLSRFEIFFPERRQFFLENADLFSSFGFGNINPFFSRRIGVATNKDDETVQNRIYGGARLSGKLSDNTRIGLLNMHTSSDDFNAIAGANYLVAALQQKVLDRSNVSFLFVNKQLFGSRPDDFNLDKFNRVAGVDFNYATADNRWFGKTFLHTSFSPDIDGLPVSHGTEFTFNKRGIELTWSHEYVNEDYEAAVGFINRDNYFRINPSAEFRTWPSNEWINDVGLRLSSNVWWQPGLGRTDHEYSVGLSTQFANTSRINFEINHEYVYLFDEFDPTGTDSEPLLIDTDYNFVNLRANFRSDNRKSFAYNFRTFLGSYFNGNRFNLGGSVTLRYQPKGAISIDYNYNTFDMPHLDERKSTFLIGPRVDYTFSRALFFSTFLQYNTQSQNTNINSRLQWRFAPVSDFFLVYTDNYLSGAIEPGDRFSWNIKNRSIVAKLTYWINS